MLQQPNSGKELERGLTPPGLTSAQAAAGLAQFGYNEPAPPRKRAGLIQLLLLFLNPLIVILLIAPRPPPFWARLPTP